MLWLPAGDRSIHHDRLFSVMQVPINKNLYSASYILITGGITGRVCHVVLMTAAQMFNSTVTMTRSLSMKDQET